MKTKKYYFHRILTYILSFSLIMGLCACGKKSEDTQASSEPGVTEITPAPTSQETILKKDEYLEKAPEAYLDAVLIQINPSFMLFVNERDEVVNCVPMNEDAEKMREHCNIDGRRIQDALMDIVNVAYDDGYLKPGGTVNVTMVESFRTEDDAQNRMNDLEVIINQVSQDRNVEIKPEMKLNEDISYAQDQGNPPPGDNNNNPPPEDDNNIPPTQESDPNNQPGPEPSDDHDHDHETEPPKDNNGGNDGGDNGGNGGGKQEGCPVCQGSGKCTRCNLTGYVECMSCHGTGEKDCDCDGGFDRNPCPCGGDGKCYRCEGTGIFEDKTCDVCGGNGKCKECNGVGRRTCNKCGGAGQTICEECQGSGKEICQGCQGSLICEACGGSGLNPHKQT